MFNCFIVLYKDWGRLVFGWGLCSASFWQLEQWCECRAIHVEFEQWSCESEQQHWVSLLQQFSKPDLFFLWIGKAVRLENHINLIPSCSTKLNKKLGVGRE